MPYDVIVTITGDVVGQFASGKEANAFVKELKGQGNAGPFRIIFKEDAEPAWHKRERDRFADGMYKPLPEWLTTAEWYTKFAPAHHYAHPSKIEPTGKIAFTPTPEMGTADKQRAMRVGAYFEMYFNSSAVIEAGRPAIPKLVSLWRAYYSGLKLSFDITYSGRKIAEIYTEADKVSPNGEDGCSSCMSGNNEEEDGWPEGIHPAFVYGIDAPPGHPNHDKALALIYATNAYDDYVGRVVVWPAKKVHSTIYANDEEIYEMFLAYLESEGYERGSFEGAYIRKHPLSDEVNDWADYNDDITEERPFSGSLTYYQIANVMGLNRFDIDYHKILPILYKGASALEARAVTTARRYLCPFIDRLRGAEYYLHPEANDKFILTHTQDHNSIITTYTNGYTETTACYMAEDGVVIHEHIWAQLYRTVAGDFALANLHGQSENFTPVIDYQPIEWPDPVPFYMKTKDTLTLSTEVIRFNSNPGIKGIITPAAKEKFADRLYSCPVLSYFKKEALVFIDNKESYQEDLNNPGRSRYFIPAPDTLIVTPMHSPILINAICEAAPCKYYSFRGAFFVHVDAHPLLKDMHLWQHKLITRPEFQKRHPTLLSGAHLPSQAHYAELDIRAFRQFLQELCPSSINKFSSFMDSWYSPAIDLIGGDF